MAYIDSYKAYEAISKVIDDNNLSGEEVLDILTDYHGLSLCTAGLMEHFKEEGYDIDMSEVSE